MSSPEGRLLLYVAKQAVNDYWCWRWRKGTKHHREAGSSVKKWVVGKEGIFSLMAFAFNRSEEKLQELFFSAFEDVEKKRKPGFIGRSWEKN